ncbi:MAG: lamin tail domain-containing protein [Myxococcota bacterium]
MRWLILTGLVACAPQSLEGDDGAVTVLDASWNETNPLFDELLPPPGTVSPASFDLSMGVVVSGEPVTFTVTGAPPNANVYVLWSSGGVTPGACPVQIGGECLGISTPPIRLIPGGPLVTNASGEGSLTVTAPAGPPLDLAFQAAIPATDQTSNVIGTSMAAAGTSTVPFLDRDADGVTFADGDCDDHNGTVFPGAPDTDGDFVDSDCDGFDTQAPIPVVTAEDINTGVVALGTMATVQDMIVVGMDDDGEPIFVQQSGYTAHAGFEVYGAGTVAVGDVLEMTGSASNPYGLMRFDPTSVTVTGTSALPAPVVLDPSTSDFEAYEGMLVTFGAVTVDNPSLGFGEISVTDGAASFRIDDLAVDILTEFPSLAVGDTFSSVSGVWGYSFSNHKLWPMSVSDLAGYVPVPQDTGADTDVVDAADLYITELADPNNNTAARYVEIHNPGAADVDLVGWTLIRWTNDSTSPQAPVALTGTVPAGGFYVVCNNSGAFSTAYGVDCDQDIGTGGAADSNGDDNIGLQFNGAMVDLFGVPGEDGSGTAHEFEDGRAERACSNTAPAAVWDAAGWDVDNDSGGGAGAQDAPGGFDPGAWSCLGGGGTDTGIVDTGTDTDTDTPAPPPIVTAVDINTGVVALGDTVMVQDMIVVGMATSGTPVYVQQSGFYFSSGFEVYGAGAVAIGDVLEMTGSASEPYGMTRFDPTAVTITGTAALPAPIALDPSVDDFELYESMLVSFGAVEVDNADLGFGEFSVTDGAASFRIDDLAFDVGAAFPNLAVGDAFSGVTGVMGYTFGNHKVWPGSAADLAGYVPYVPPVDTSGGDTDVVAAADLLITELADPNNNTTARYVEIHNPGTSDVDLSTGWALVRWTNDSTTSQTPVALTGTVPAGGFYVVCNNGGAFLTAYGVDCDQDIGTGGAADSNGDDNIGLEFNGTMIDLFGLPGEDGSGTAHEFEDGRAERACSNTAPAAVWDAAGWDVDNDSGGGDGAQDAPGVFDPGAWSCLGGGGTDTGTGTGGGTDTDTTTDTDVAGDVLFITELADPNNNSAARYVELHNPGTADVDLSTGWALVRWTNDSTTSQTPVPLFGTVPAGGYYIVCNDGVAFSGAYGVDCDEDIGTNGAADSNGDDNIGLEFNGTMIDLFGVPGEDGSGTAHEFEDGRAERACSNTAPAAVWDAAGWDVDNDSGGGAGAQDAPGGFDPGAWVCSP